VAREEKKNATEERKKPWGQKKIGAGRQMIKTHEDVVTT